MINNSIFYFLYSFAHQSALVDNLIVFFAVYFPYLVILLALVLLFFYHGKTAKEVLLVFSSAGAAWLVAKIIKTLIHASRPFISLPDMNPLFFETGYAFPSGHATFFMALGVSIFFYHKKAGYLFMLFALVIGLARVAAGVHFPLDILGGFILGGAVSGLVAY